MAHSILKLGAAAAVAALTLGTASLEAQTINRSVDSVHQPIVSRVDYVLDVAATPYGLAPHEAARLSGWFDGLDLGYGDTITLDEPMGSRSEAASDGISAVVARYGILVSHESAPMTVGHPAADTIRVVVSRATARVEGCPNYSHGRFSEYASSTASNFGCAAASNLAAMIANPEDLIEGHAGSPASDAQLSVKAIKTYRDAAATGANGVKQESAKAGGN